MDTELEGLEEKCGITEHQQAEIRQKFEGIKSRYEELEKQVAQADEQIGELQQSMNDTGVSKENWRDRSMFCGNRSIQHSRMRNMSEAVWRHCRPMWTASRRKARITAAGRRNWKPAFGDRAEEAFADRKLETLTERDRPEMEQQMGSREGRDFAVC